MNISINQLNNLPKSVVFSILMNTDSSSLKKIENLTNSREIQLLSKSVLKLREDCICDASGSLAANFTINDILSPTN